MKRQIHTSAAAAYFVAASGAAVARFNILNPGGPRPSIAGWQEDWLASTQAQRVLAHAALLLCFLVFLSLFMVWPGHADAGMSDKKSLTLWDYGLIESESGREVVRDLVGCALPEDALVSAEVAGERIEFKGSLGLAPDWLKRPLSEVEQRWLSACLIARLNFFGLSVDMSLQAPASSLPALTPTPETQAAFPRHMASFYGNLFAPTPEAHACAVAGSQEARTLAMLKKRTCAILSRDPLFNLQGFSMCQLEIVTDCTGEEQEHRGDARYGEVVEVYLKPHERPSLAGNPGNR